MALLGRAQSIKNLVASSGDMISQVWLLAGEFFRYSNHIERYNLPEEVLRIAEKVARIEAVLGVRG